MLERHVGGGVGDDVVEQKWMVFTDASRPRIGEKRRCYVAVQ